MSIGLLLLLATLTATVSQLVVRALRASHQIEASDKAYLAAEGGVEDALYELSIHDAGYETAPLGNTDVRSDHFSDDLIWKNEWQIAGRDTSSCDDMDPWVNSYDPELCGRVYPGKKHVISLSSDNAPSLSVPVNGINEALPDVEVPGFTALTIRFRLPRDVVADNLAAFSDPFVSLMIDNDRDYNPDTGQGLNEDGADLALFPLNPCPYSGAVEISDNDCDGREDEDSPQDPVFIWQLIDGDGNTWKPLRGCKGDPALPEHSTYPNGLICETTFERNEDQVHAAIDMLTDYGTDQDGNIVSLNDFIDSYAYAADSLKLEIVPAAPFEAIYSGASATDPSRIPFPYLEYGIDYSATDTMSSAHFAVRSDGYFQAFKQSITTSVMPEGATRLLDLTIIQQ